MRGPDSTDIVWADGSYQVTLAAIQQALAEESNELTANQTAILQHLAEHPEAGTKNTAKYVGVNPQYVTKVLTKFAGETRSFS